MKRSREWQRNEPWAAGPRGLAASKLEGGVSIKDFRNIPTNALWSAIEENARLAQKHVYWLEYLDNVRVLCALIDERIEVFERRMRLERAMKEHRTGWSWEKVGFADGQTENGKTTPGEVVVLSGGGDNG